MVKEIGGPLAARPLIHIHYVERGIHGRGEAVKVYGEMRIAAQERVFARELLLKDIEVLLLTPETTQHTGYMAQKWVADKGTFNNYASIDIFDDAGNEITAGSRFAPADGNGSIWLNFLAVGD